MAHRYRSSASSTGPQREPTRSRVRSSRLRADRAKQSVPGILESEAHDISNARYCLKGSDLLDVFEPVIEEILTLVSGQIDATEAGKGVVKAVLLVGGFGESSYLGERVRQACLPRHVAVWKPPHA